MKKIRRKTFIAIACVALMYIEAYLLCIVERTRAFSNFVLYRDFIFVGLMLFSLYAMCHFLPTNIVPKVKTVSLIIISVSAILASVILNTSNSNTGFIIEIIALGAAALLSMFQCVKVLASLAKQKPNEYVLYEYRVYKYHELNILNFVMFLAFLGATLLTGFNWLTVLYAILGGLLLIITNYRVMFGARFNFGTLARYLLQTVAIVSSFLYAFLVSRFALPSYMYLLLFVPIILYGYYTVRLWKEFRYYLYK